MLDQQSGSRSGGQWPETLQVLSKCLRTLAIFFAWDYLRNFHLPIAVYVFVLLVGSAFFFLLVQRPWRGQKPIRWIRIGKYSLLYVLNLVFWHVGLKCYGPLRTILAADYGDTIMAPLLRKGKAQRSSKLPGAVLVVVSYLLLLWSYDPQANSGDITAGGAEVQRSNDFFGISDRIVGGVAILVAVVLNVIRRKYSKGLSLQLGSSKRLFSLSVVMGAAFLSPFATFSYFTAEPFGFSFLGFLFSMCGIILFFVIVEYYVANGRKGDRSGTAGRRTKLELMASLAIAFALEWWSGSSGSTFALSAVNVIFFSLMLLGIQLRFTGGKNGLGSSNSDMLPLYGSIAQRGDTMAIGRWVYNFLKTTLKEVLKNADSRNIFLFLVLNLMFMFVEMLYGYWTNSLGLISDGFHMLFDCIALLIGLGASVISKWKANDTLTYGYGRVEVLSGFINGIFLIFVAFFVLMESMERFMDPPKIETEQLLLVSVLGFMVNMVGIFAFSHGHSHGGHGHSHGGHGHSHGEKKHSHGEKKHGEKKHGHSHSHGEAGGHGHSHGEKKHKDKHKHGDKKHKHKHDHDHHDHHDHDHHEHDHHDHDHDHQHDEHCEHDHHDHAHDHHDHAHDHHDHAHDHEHAETPSHRRRHKSHHSHGSQGKEYVTVHLHDLEGELEKEVPKKQGWCRCFSGLGANLSGIGLHVLADTLGSVSVIISSSLIMLFDWHIADPICSFCIAIMIAVSVIPLFQECIASLSQRVPDQLQPTLEGILQQIRGMEEVIEVREFHVWEHSSTVVVGTAIILLQDDADEQAVRLAVTPLFQEHCQYFTLQLIKKRFFELEGELHKRNYGQSFNFMAPLSSPAFIGGADVGYPGAGSGGLSSSGGLGGSGGALSRYGQSDSMLASHTSPPGSLTISVVNNNL